MKTGPTVRVGVAGWSISKEHHAAFDAQGSHLERYAGALNAVEINSSFYRPHRRQTYARWASSVPHGFRFCVKAPKAMTHNQRLRDCEEHLAQFVAEFSGLGDKLGCILVQLPPSLKFDISVVKKFFKLCRTQYPGPLVCEPRHPTWFVSEVDRILEDYQVGRVAADPQRHPDGMRPAGDSNVIYFRLHGSPKIYYSAYSSEQIAALAEQLLKSSSIGETWCIFDNTAEGFALANALQLKQTIETMAKRISSRENLSTV